jgi:hypothetical protein
MAPTAEGFETCPGKPGKNLPTVAGAAEQVTGVMRRWGRDRLAGPDESFRRTHNDEEKTEDATSARTVTRDLTGDR